MSTSTSKLIEEKTKAHGELRWLSGFAVFGSLLTLPGLLPVTRNLDLDGDPRQAGSRFFAFNIGFLFAWALSSPLLKKFGVRPLAVAGLSFAIASLIALTVQPPSMSFWWELLPVCGTGIAAGAVSIGSLFALKPWSSQLGARALPRLVEFAGVGCVFSSVIAGSGYASGWERFTPVPIAAGAFLCLVFCITGRRPLAVIPKRNSPPDATIRQRRSIAAFLLLCLLFVQLGSEWSIAAWLPLFLIHRLGSGPSEAIFILAFYFLALLSGRALAQKLKPRLSSRSLAIGGTVLALAGCITLGLSTSLIGIVAALITLSVGFAPPYSIVKDILDESLHFAPGFYRATLAMAVGGAMSSAWLLGYVHQVLGMQALSLLPAAGSVIALLLELLLMFESHLMSERAPVRPHLPAIGRRTS